MLPRGHGLKLAQFDEKTAELATVARAGAHLQMITTT